MDCRVKFMKIFGTQGNIHVHKYSVRRSFSPKSLGQSNTFYREYLYEVGTKMSAMPLYRNILQISYPELLKILQKNMA